MNKKNKTVIILIICSFLILISGCKNTNTAAVDSYNLDVINEGQMDVNEVKGNDLIDEATTIPLDKEFYNIIENNPIDVDFTWEDIGTENRISRACEYRDVWMIEIENTLNILEEYLSEDDYSKMKEAYKGWKQYMENTLEVERSIFYVGSEYAGISKIAGDSLTYPRVMEIVAVRTRNYAIELMSLEYAFTNDVNFVYGR